MPLSDIVLLSSSLLPLLLLLFLGDGDVEQDDEVEDMEVEEEEEQEDMVDGEESEEGRLVKDI